MRDYAAQTPGALVEEKSGGVAWHYRLVEHELGLSRALPSSSSCRGSSSARPPRSCRARRSSRSSPGGVHKGRLVPLLAARAPAGALLVAIGDDRTDEDLFAALPPGALAVHVGPEPTAAAIRLEGVPDVRSLLRAVVGSPAPLTRDALSWRCCDVARGPSALAPRDTEGARRHDTIGRRAATSAASGSLTSGPSWTVGGSPSSARWATCSRCRRTSSRRATAAWPPSSATGP